MDLAKMAALLEMIQPLAGDGFRIWRQVRTGLLSYPLDIDAARSHLATSVYLQMTLRPHIVHVVGHSEAQHAATAGDVIEACKIARTAIEKALNDQPQILADPRLQQRKDELMGEARVTLEHIRSMGASGAVDPFTSPKNLARAVTNGVLDAPHLRSNRFARGQIRTKMDQRGACVAVDPRTGKPLSEAERLAALCDWSKDFLK
jgi:hypothetical protein